MQAEKKEQGFAQDDEFGAWFSNPAGELACPSLRPACFVPACFACFIPACFACTCGLALASILSGAHTLQPLRRLPPLHVLTRSLVSRVLTPPFVPPINPNRRGRRRQRGCGAVPARRPRCGRCRAGQGRSGRSGRSGAGGQEGKDCRLWQFRCVVGLSILAHPTPLV